MSLFSFRLLINFFFLFPEVALFPLCVHLSIYEFSRVPPLCQLTRWTVLPVSSHGRAIFFCHFLLLLFFLSPGDDNDPVVGAPLKNLPEARLKADVGLHRHPNGDPRAFVRAAHDVLHRPKRHLLPQDPQMERLHELHLGAVGHRRHELGHRVPHLWKRDIHGQAPRDDGLRVDKVALVDCWVVFAVLKACVLAFKYFWGGER
mmetsp:Transcript_64968/g.130655  ORF Transcript_64968/g.130655 Transcript_64968/m.130655 type:complete len:203 (-) Transcript_64968:370-978(-)